MKYVIFPPEELIEEAHISLPQSKSIVARRLILDALAGIYPADDDPALTLCDDTRTIAQALQTELAARPSRQRVVLDLGASGAALRFLTAFFAATPGACVELTGTPRLMERPMKELIDALGACGASISRKHEQPGAPLLIDGCHLRGGDVTIDPTISSQFISALLMVAPTMQQGLTLRLDGEPVSLPYIAMTLAMMEQRAVTADREPLVITVPQGSYKPFAQPCEGDWSAAAFWFEVSALSAGWITLDNLSPDSIQGDRRAADYFSRLGVNVGEPEVGSGGVELQPSPEVFGRLDLDLTDNPDLAPALAITCCLIGIPFKITGLQTLASKECDRLGAICAEMAKIGRDIERIRNYGLEWDGKSHPVASFNGFSAHGDHRIAMALAPAAVYIPGISIDGVEVVSKSYPGWWDHLRSVGFIVGEPDEVAAGEAPREEARP